MARTREYQVKDNRIRFKCVECNSKRSLPVPSNLRWKSLRCHGCGTQTRCILNRRLRPREQQSGKAIMTLLNGHKLPVELRDISATGVGVHAAPRSAAQVSLREVVDLKCSWNSELFANGRYIVQSITGQRIGIQNIAYRMLL